MLFWAMILGFLVLSPFVVLPYLAIVASIFSYKIKTQVELEKIIKNEAKILKLSRENIKIFFIIPPEPYFTADSMTMADNSHLIRCVRGSPRTVVPHELFHIHDGIGEKSPESKHNNRTIDFLKYWYWQEPRAIFYEFCRLRACNRI